MFSHHNTVLLLDFPLQFEFQLFRDYRLPNPNGLKGLRITAEAKKATTQAIKKEQQVEYRRAQNMATRVRAGDQPYKATTYHMHRRRQAGKH